MSEDFGLQLTRANVRKLLDARCLEAAMRNGRWWEMRANGATQTWKRDASRIRIPFKVGLKECGAITEDHFGPDGTLRPEFFRVKANKMDYARQVVARV